MCKRALTTSKNFQALQEFLNKHKDPELLVMGNAFWSICCKPNHTLATEEYASGLRRLLPVYLPIFIKNNIILLAK